MAGSGTTLGMGGAFIRCHFCRERDAFTAGLLDSYLPVVWMPINDEIQSNDAEIATARGSRGRNLAP
jgi:hypothetical protein